MAISFVSAGTVYTRSTAGTSYTLNAPAGVAVGDFMVATIAFDPNASIVSPVTLPTGWTSIRLAFGATGGGSVETQLAYRVYLSGDPSSWTANISVSTTMMIAGVSAYRGVQGILASNAAAVGSATSLSTNTVNNTIDTTTWRITAGAYYSATTSYTIASNETTRRMLGSVAPSNAIQVAQWDSNAGVATGNHSRTVSRSAVWTTAVATIALLEASTGTPSLGTATMVLGTAEQDFEVDVTDPATMAMSLGNVTMDGIGAGQPIEGTGDVTLQLGGISQDFAGGPDPGGSMDMVFLPSVDIVAETRTFGVRVITVEYDTSRRIIVPSRGVDD